MRHPSFVFRTVPLTLYSLEIDLQLVHSVCFTTLGGLGFGGIMTVTIRNVVKQKTEQYEKQLKFPFTPPTQESPINQGPASSNMQHARCNLQNEITHINRSTFL